MHKTREKNRVVGVERRVIYGTVTAVVAALAASLVSTAVNTVFVERESGTDRNRNARKVRKTYCFSKGWGVPALCAISSNMKSRFFAGFQGLAAFWAGLPNPPKGPLLLGPLIFSAVFGVRV